MMDTRRNLAGVFAHALRAAVADLNVATVPSAVTNVGERSASEARDNAIATIVAVADELDHVATEDR